MSLLVGCLGCFGIVAVALLINVLVVLAIRYVALAFLGLNLAFWPTLVVVLLLGWLLSALRGSGRAA